MSFTVSMLDSSARISSPDSEVLAVLAGVFHDLRVPDTSAVAVEVHVRAGSCHGQFAVDIDGCQEWAGDGVVAVVQECVVRLNRVAVERCTDLALHAGGLEHDGVGLLLPAASESGKSTLTAGLVRAGLRYLSDEAVPIGWDTALARPYPKPISLDPGAFALFPEWTPEFGIGHDPHAAAQGHIAPGSARPDAVGAPCPIGFVVFPQYLPGAATRLEPVSKGTALLELCKNTFRFNQHGRRALDHLAPIASDAACLRLIMGDLAPAVDLLLSLLGATRP